MALRNFRYGMLGCGLPAVRLRCTRCPAEAYLLLGSFIAVSVCSLAYLLLNPEVDALDGVEFYGQIAVLE